MATNTANTPTCGAVEEENQDHNDSDSFSCQDSIIRNMFEDANLNGTVLLTPTESGNITQKMQWRKH